MSWASKGKRHSNFEIGGGQVKQKSNDRGWWKRLLLLQLCFIICEPFIVIIIAITIITLHVRNKVLLQSNVRYFDTKKDCEFEAIVQSIYLIALIYFSQTATSRGIHCDRFLYLTFKSVQSRTLNSIRHFC